MPVVKWVGGKRQLLSALTPLLPKHITAHCEPFLGGGALLFSCQPKKAIVNDLNQDLMNMYTTIRDDVETLIRELEAHKNESEHYYQVRDWDRDREKYESLSNAQKAARLIFLNKTCYNGLFRVNNAGEFNTPFGSYKNPNIVNAPTLKAVHNYFQSAKIAFSSRDYSEVLEDISKNTFVYLDPPYDTVSDTAAFTGYCRGGFGREDQIRLRKCCDELDKKGIKFMLSNSATSFIREQYSAYDIKIIHARRAINSDGARRGYVDEVVIRNY